MRRPVLIDKQKIGRFSDVIVPSESTGSGDLRSHLPTDLSGREVRATLERLGFVFRRQRGSHMILRRDDPFARVVIPDHKQVRMGTRRRILADAGISSDEFLRALRR